VRLAHKLQLPVACLLLATALLLGSCPAQEHGGSDAATGNTSAGVAGTAGGAGGGTASLSPAPPPDIAPALDYIRWAAKLPAPDGAPPASLVWNAVARLAGYGSSTALLQPLEPLLQGHIDAAPGGISPQLAGAWLAVSGQPGYSFIADKLAAGQYSYLQPLQFDAAAARGLLATLPLADMPGDAATQALEILRGHGIIADDAGLLKQLARHEAPAVSLRAIGYLDSFEMATAAQLAELKRALASADIAEYVPALEGVKCSGKAEWANDLVELVAGAQLGAEDPETEPRPQVLYAAYALAYLPGSQAQLMRQRLVGAASPVVRWQARLGELMHGEPQLWHDAVDVLGVDSPGMWQALAPPEAHHPALLATLERAAEEGSAQSRLQAVQQLPRYNEPEVRGRVTALLKTLAQDEDTAVRAMALVGTAQLAPRLLADECAASCMDEDEPWEVRLAASYCLLAAAEHSADLTENGMASKKDET
jgi:hypothetical protein